LNSSIYCCKPTSSLRHTKRFSLPAGDYRPQIAILACSPCWQKLREAVLQLGPAGSVAFPDTRPLPSFPQRLPCAEVEGLPPLREQPRTALGFWPFLASLLLFFQVE